MNTATRGSTHDDNAALRFAAGGNAALATITHIDGSFSRRLGAQLAIGRDGALVGSMADGCLEGALISLAQEAWEDGRPRFVHFGGAGDPMDLRLPCGSRIAVTLDPAPDMRALGDAVDALDARRCAEIAVPLADGSVMRRAYRPGLRIVAFGTGPELSAFERLAETHGAIVQSMRPHGEGADTGLSLGQAPEMTLDAWTAVVVLFHDHEWERAILPAALTSDAFYIGAQGGAAAREARAELISSSGLTERAQGRLHGPVGLIGRARDPAVLALSVLAEIVAAYETLA